MATQQQHASTEAGIGADPLTMHTQVAIVGGGPVGTALAIELAQRGVASVIIERHGQPQRVPKGQNLTQRTMEHFRNWGIEDELRAARTLPAEQRATGMTIYDTLQGEYSYPWLQRERVADYYATANERLPQYATEAVLRQRLADFPDAHMVKRWTATGVTQDADGATVSMRAADGRVGTVRADYVVGCDGSGSIVRESAGITQSRVDHDRLMALLVFKSDDFERIMERHPGVAFANVLHPKFAGYWQFFGRVDAQKSWFFHAPVPAGSTVDTVDIAGVLEHAIGAPISFEIDYLGFWDLRFTLADQYRQQRVFVAGDAAHSHPPYGGYGINSGFEDVANLGWKLAAVLDRWADSALLDSYDAERRPVFASTRDDFIARSIEQDRVFLAGHDPRADRASFEAAWGERELLAQSEPGAFAPNYAGSPVIPGSSGSPSALADHDFRARAGFHLAPAVTAAGEPVFDALGPGFTLLVAPNTDVSEWVEGARAEQIPVGVLEVSAEHMLRYGAEVVLVRPDQFVAWAGSRDDAMRLNVLGCATARSVPVASR